MLNNGLENKIKSIYSRAIKSGNREIFYLILIGTKVILGNKGSISNSIDNDRLYDELVYYRYYSQRTNTYLLNFTIALILTNRSYNLYESQVVDLIGKITKFYQQEEKKYDYILDQYIYDCLYRYTLISVKVDLLEFIYEIKEKLLLFNPYKNDKKENIGLQVRKIKYIEDLHLMIDYFERGEDRFQKEIYLNSDFLDLLRKSYDEDEVVKLESGLVSVSEVILYLLGMDNSFSFRKNKIQEYENFSDFDLKLIESMAEYCIRLRNNEVSSKKYRDISIEKSSPKNMLKYRVGDVFVDPVLNRCKVLSKDYTNQFCKMNIMTKTGSYEFVFRGRGEYYEK